MVEDLQTMSGGTRMSELKQIKLFLYTIEEIKKQDFQKKEI